MLDAGVLRRFALAAGFCMSAAVLGGCVVVPVGRPIMPRPLVVVPRPPLIVAPAYY